MKTLKNREISHKFNTGWVVGTVKGVEQGHLIHKDKDKDKDNEIHDKNPEG